MWPTSGWSGPPRWSRTIRSCPQIDVPLGRVCRHPRTFPQSADRRCAAPLRVSIKSFLIETRWVPSGGYVSTLPPLVDRDGRAVVRAEDAPVAVGLAADDDDLDLVLLEHVDHLVRIRFEHRRVWLLTVRRPRVD